MTATRPDLAPVGVVVLLGVRYHLFRHTDGRPGYRTVRVVDQLATDDW